MAIMRLYPEDIVRRPQQDVYLLREDTEGDQAHVIETSTHIDPVHTRAHNHAGQGRHPSLHDHAAGLYHEEDVTTDEGMFRLRSKGEIGEEEALAIRAILATAIEAGAEVVGDMIEYNRDVTA